MITVDFTRPIRSITFRRRDQTRRSPEGELGPTDTTDTTTIHADGRIEWFITGHIEHEPINRSGVDNLGEAIDVERFKAIVAYRVRYGERVTAVKYAD